MMADKEKGPPPPPPAPPLTLPPLPPAFPAPVNKISPANLHKHLCDQSHLSPEKSIQQAVDRFIKFNSKYSDHQFVCFNHHTVAQLQEGPQCGIVALCMAAGEGVKVDEVQQEARRRGFTLQGEMFSVDNMASLARDVLNTAAHVVSSEVIRDPQWLLRCFSTGGLILIPYDCGPNHGPAMFKGKKAHWALLTGLVAVSSQLPQHVQEKSKVTELPNIHILDEKNDFPEKTSIYVFGRQSKSVVLGVWNIEDLINSNNNLEDIDQCRDEGYVIPDGGVREGLCGKIVILNFNQ